ncbi:ead/Ea22-like family protein [Pseudomonas fluorescens]|uniref:ead/Ea22-like family protein n=1 Tax=Pseudomonas fluorescens TaxID=294 RepID=UPI0021D0E08B|nr:ead/Ea22-like family protein [Pseudomonas fluorescens]UXV21041.1 ead/Ea22-like family protein [Pseudomonas fluorescens]
MTAYAELKRLAEAATPGTWRTGEWMPKETVGRHQIVVDTDDGPYVIFEGNQNFMDDARANAAFVAEASPVVILGMIAELESTNDRLHEVSVACATAEQGRDAYRAVLEGAGYQNVEAIGKLSPFDSKNIGNLAATMTMGIQQERDQLKVECEALVSAMNDILRVTPMGVEAFGIAALVLGELSSAAMGQGEQS